MVDWVGLAIPFLYLTVLVGSLATFSSLYRKRKAASAANLEPWFPSHTPRDIYLSLLHLDEKIPDSVLKAALLQRACEDIRRILAIRNQKGPLNTLLQRGSVGDDLLQRFSRAEKEIEAELRDVVEEANALSTNWGQTIFQSANEMVNNEMIRDKVAEIQAKGQEDKEWWEKQRKSIQAEFMKELDEEDASKPSSAKSAPNPPEKIGNSDEDAVMVESGGPAGGMTTTTATTPGGETSKKKKKGKK